MKRDIFPKSFQLVIKERIRSENKHWGNYSSVIARLNEIALIRYYVSSNFTYLPEKFLAAQSPETTFNLKGGICRHLSMFGVECAEAAGLKAYNLTFLYGNKFEDGHTIGIVKKAEYHILVDSAMHYHDYPDE